MAHVDNCGEYRNNSDMMSFLGDASRALMLAGRDMLNLVTVLFPGGFFLATLAGHPCSLAGTC